MQCIDNKIVKARKEYACDWCLGKILKGSKYEKSFCKCNGEVYTWKNHIRCSLLFEKLDMGNCDDGYGIDSETFLECVREYLREQLTENEYDHVISEDKEIIKACELLEIPYLE